MSHLAKLTIVAQNAKRNQSKSEHRRAKLLEKLGDQLGIIEAQISGETFTRMRRVWDKDETGQRVPMDRVKRLRPWYWMSGAGGCYFSVWYGSRVLELKPGMTAIQVAKREELPDAIRAVIEAVQAGELDAQIEASAEKGTAELRRKTPAKPLKKAS
jgi:hypothetical protein